MVPSVESSSEDFDDFLGIPLSTGALGGVAPHVAAGGKVAIVGVQYH